MWGRYPEILDELNLVEDYIKKSVCSRNKLITEITGGLVEAGGKRLRPAFVVLSSKFGNCDGKKVISIAGALEILHTATLVHDDIVDRAKLRRGKATVSEKYGMDMAVYTGDFLFTKAVLALSEGVEASRLDTVAKAVKTICEGEVDQFQSRYDIDITILSYLKRISRKTAVLFGAACNLGAGTAECPPDIVRDLTRFGFCYGMAFQIRDDLNDFLLDEKTSGKPTINDIAKGIVTLPVIYALNRDSKIRSIFRTLAENKEGLSAGDIEIISDLVKNSGGIDASKKMLEKYIERGMKLLERLPDIKYRAILIELITLLKLY